MPILSNDRLRQTAVERCTRHISGLLDANLDIQHEQAFSEWDPILCRHVYRHRASVWRPFDEVRIKVDADGRVVSFYDANRFSDAGHASLPDTEILKIAETTGLLAKSPNVERKIRRGDGLLSAVVGHFFRGDYEEIELVINTKSAQVASFHVLPVP